MYLQPKRDTVSAQKEFLNTTQGMVAKVGGLTIDTSAFTPDANGYLKAGSGVARPTGGGLGVPYQETTAGDPSTGNGTVFVTQHDVKIDEGRAEVTVGVLESAYLKRSVVTTAEDGRQAIDDNFVNASNGRFHLR